MLDKFTSPSPALALHWAVGYEAKETWVDHPLAYSLPRTNAVIMA